MAIIYSYPVITPTADDLLLGTDQGGDGKPTKNFTVQSIVDIVAGGAAGLGAVLTISNSAKNAGGDNQSAVDFLNISGTGSVTFNSFTDGNMSITGGVGNGFTSIRSTDFVGNITGIVKAGSSIEGTVTGVTQALGTSNTTLATTAFVMSKTDPSVLTFLGTTGGNQTVNLAAQTLSLLGTTSEIKTVSSAQTLTISLADGAFGSGAELILPNGASATTQAAADNTVKVATTAFVKQENDAQDLDFTGDTGTSSVLLNSQTLDFEGTTNQVTTAVTAQKVKFSLPASVTIGGTFTGTTFSGDLNGTINTLTTGVTQTAGNNSTKIATTAYVDAAAGAKTLDYAGDATGPFALNLSTDDLEFNGDSNITVTAATVAANKGIVTIDLNNAVTITGKMQAGTLSDGTFSGSAGTYTGGVSIESDTFTATTTPIGFIGNATTATALAAPGTIQLTSGSGVTQGVASNAVTYTSGGNVSLTTSLANTTVTAKTLFNLPTPTSTAITASDTILAAMAKLQGQITGIPQGLVYKGTWNAATNTPTLASGTGVTGEFYIVAVAGTTNLDGITDWQIGDWAIFVEVGATDTWQKIDNSQSIIGSGATNKIARWTAPTVLGTGLIEDDGTTVTIGSNGNLTVLGDTILGDNAAADTITLNGPTTFNSTGIFKVGIGLGPTPNYGLAGQVLTSGGGSGVTNTWTTPTVGTVTSVTAGTGITVGGTAAAPTVAIDYLGTDNAILSAPQENGIATTDTVWFSDATDDNIKKTTVANLIALDGARSLAATLAVGNTSGANNILMADSQSVNFGAGNDLRISHNGTDSQINNFTGNLQFTQLQDDGDISFASDNGSGGDTIYMTIDGGSVQTKFFKQTEHQDNVLGGYGSGMDLQLHHNATDSFIDNYTGNLYFRNFADDKNITLQSDDGSGGIATYLEVNGAVGFTINYKMQNFQDNVLATFGNGSDLSIYHDANDSYIRDTGTGFLYIDTDSTIRMISDGSFANGKMATFDKDGPVELYYNNSKKFGTTSAGVTFSNLSNTSAASSSVDEVKIGTFGAGRPAIYFGSSNTTYTNSTWFIENIGAAGKLRIGRNGLDVVEIFNDGNTTFAGSITAGDGNFTGNVEIDGNLTVDGHIIHGGGGGGTGKGGQFTKLYTTGNAGVAGIAFTIDRASSGSMVFDVMLTSDNSNSVSIAKKFTVASKLGVQAPIFNKTVDTGPDGSNDFAVAFAADGTSNTKIKCTITPAGMNTQKIGITIDLGFGQNNATVVMNA